jgi:preprotein translocase subunit SecB
MAEEGYFEVVLRVNASAKRGENTLFIAELQYGVVCSVDKAVPQDHIHPLIMIEAPKLAFPFARQILCDAVIGGGFPPLMLNPVDFEALYMHQYQEQQKQQAAS